MSPAGTRKPLEDALDALLDGVPPKDSAQKIASKKSEPKDLKQDSDSTSQESGVVTQDSSIERLEAGGQTDDTGFRPQELIDKSLKSSVSGQESGVVSQETGVLMPDSNDVLKSDSSIKRDESGVMTRESDDLTQGSVVKTRETGSRSRGEKRKSRNGTHESGVVTDDIIEQAVAHALQSPKISLYSPLLLAVLESQQLMLLNRKEMTLLHYRKATKARELVEKALMESYPDLCEKILKRINEGNGKS
jgi:hypothetical protein